MIDAISVRILQRLSQSLLSVEYPSDSDVPPDLRTFRRRVDLSFSVLRTLGETVDHLPESSPLVYNHHIHQLPFRSVGVVAPTSVAEAYDVYGQVLSHLKTILEVCVFMIGDPPMKLNGSSTIYSFSGTHHIPRFSEFHTPRRHYHQKVLNYTPRLHSTSMVSKVSESGRYCCQQGPKKIYRISSEMTVRCSRL